MTIEELQAFKCFSSHTETDQVILIDFVYNLSMVMYKSFMNEPD